MMVENPVKLYLRIDTQDVEHLFTSIRLAIEGLVCSPEEMSGFAAKLIDLIKNRTAFDLSGGAATSANQIVLRLKPSEAFRVLMATIGARD